MIVKCTQTRCAYHEQNNKVVQVEINGTTQDVNTADLCPTCSECNSPSNILEDNTCVNCHCCLKDEGFTRDGQPDINRILQKNKVLECQH